MKSRNNLFLILLESYSIQISSTAAHLRLNLTTTVVYAFNQLSPPLQVQYRGRPRSAMMKNWLNYVNSNNCKT